MVLSRRAALLFVSAAVLASSPAHAESRAWAAAKKVVPPGLSLIAGANVDKLKGSQLFRILVAQVSKSIKLDKIKEACGVDPMASVESIAVVGLGDNPELVVLAFKGLGQKQLEPCITKTDPKDFAVRWLTKDIAAVAVDHDQLTKLTAGGLATDKTFAALIGKLSTDSAIWMAMSKSKPIGDAGATMSAAYGTVTLTPPHMDVELHLVVDSEKGASGAAKFATSKIEEAKKHLPKAMPDALDHVTARAHGNELIIGGPFPEKDFMSLAMTMAVTP